MKLHRNLVLAATTALVVAAVGTGTAMAGEQGPQYRPPGAPVAGFHVTAYPEQGPQY
jgi:hypothetical protein